MSSFSLSLSLPLSLCLIHTLTACIYTTEFAFLDLRYTHTIHSLSYNVMHSHSFVTYHTHTHSVNKQNSEFTPNTDETVCQGHKWGLLALWRYMHSQLGINTDRVWDSIKDLVIKTIISSEPYVSSYVKAFVKNRWEH